MKKLLAALVLFAALFQASSLAQDFVYTPINPAFGGNPYNFNWLLGQAEAQNFFEEETEDPFDS
jgi:curli production assembly/transport component CsgF